MAVVDREPRAVRVVGVGFDPLAREGLRSFLSSAAGITLIDVVGSLPRLYASLNRHAADVVVVAKGRDPASGLGVEALSELGRGREELGLVVLADDRDAAVLSTLLIRDAGLALMRRRGLDPTHLVEVVRLVARGDRIVDPGFARVVAARLQRVRTGAGRDLTPRENQVLELLAEGQSNAGVARTLVVTEHAVEKHINAIYRKLGIVGSERHPRVAATLWYLRRQRDAEAQIVGPPTQLRAMP